MPKRVAIGIVTSDKMKQSRRVEIPRLVKHPKYGKYMRRKTVCHVHDEQGLARQCAERRVVAAQGLYRNVVNAHVGHLIEGSSYRVAWASAARTTSSPAGVPFSFSNAP